jgi:hypothetical protein
MFITAVSLSAMLASVLAGVSRWRTDHAWHARQRRLHRLPGDGAGRLCDAATRIVARAETGRTCGSGRATMMAAANDIRPTKGA